MNPVMLDAGIPTMLPDFSRFKRDDGGAEEALTQVQRELGAMRQAMNSLLRVFHGIGVETGGDVYMEVTPNGVQFGLERPLGTGTGGGTDTTLPWYASNDGTYFTCNGGLVLRLRGLSGYVHDDLIDCTGAGGDELALPTDGNYRTYGVSVEVASFACTASWAAGTEAATFNAAFDNFAGGTDADTIRWPIATYLNTSGTYTKEIQSNTTGTQHHLGGALVLPVYG